MHDSTTAIHDAWKGTKVQKSMYPQDPPMLLSLEDAAMVSGWSEPKAIVRVRTALLEAALAYTYC